MTYISSTSSTSSIPNHWIGIRADGGLVSSPDSTTSFNRGLILSDRLADAGTYLGWNLSPALISGSATGPLILAVEPAGTATTRYYDGTFFGDLQTDGANYLSVVGSTAGDNPRVQANGADTNIDLALDPKGSGVVNFDYPTAGFGGGAGATLGVVSTGSTGPQTTAQNDWLQIQINGTAYWIPVWR